MMLFVDLPIGLVQVEQMKVMLTLMIAIGYGHIVAIFVAEIGVVLLYAAHAFPLKLVWGRLAKYLSRHGSMRTIVIVGHEGGLLIVVAQ